MGLDFHQSVVFVYKFKHTKIVCSLGPLTQLEVGLGHFSPVADFR